MTLKLVNDDSPALDKGALTELGRQLVATARGDSLDAIRASMIEQAAQTTALTVVDIRRWRDSARDAARAWSKVERPLSELLNEIDKTRDAVAHGRALSAADCERCRGRGFVISGDGVHFTTEPCPECQEPDPRGNQ